MDSERAKRRQEAALEALRDVEASLGKAGAPLVEQAASAETEPAPSKAAEPASSNAQSSQTPAAPSPVIAIHGVGNFNFGDVIAQIASSRTYSKDQDYRRQTIYANNYRFTLLEDDKAAVNGRSTPRLLEVNWSDVRKPLDSVLGLLKNFALIVITIARIGVYGAYGSHSLGKPLRTPLVLYAVEGLFVWVSLLPLLSALLWKVDVAARLGVGVVLGLVAFYIAWLVRNISKPLMVGGLVYGLVAMVAGYIACTQVTRVSHIDPSTHLQTWQITQQSGRELVSMVFGAWHSWTVIIVALILLVSAVEVLFFMPHDEGHTPTWLQRIARLACLWLPVVLLVIVQPLTVSGVLVTLSAEAQHNWGRTFETAMAFSPRAGLFAGGLIAIAMLALIIMGALQYKLVNWRGRNTAMLVCLSLGASLMILARWEEASMAINCRCCIRPDWIAFAGLALIGSGIVTYLLYRDRHTWQFEGKSRLWHPSGRGARLWVVGFLWAFPFILLGAIAVLLWHVLQGHQYVAPFLQPIGPCSLRNSPITVDEAFLQATKYALVLLPFASKPVAALLDALGDVFYFVVKQDSLHTREDTIPRLARALQNMASFSEAGKAKRIILFAHSQGTVVAAALLSRISQALKASENNITLVTVGSPVTSLYERFLGVRVGENFAFLCAQEPKRFRWVNLCRPADYIGSSVELKGVENKALLTPGDHTEYWRDEVLLQWLFDRSTDVKEGQSAHEAALKPIVSWAQ